jgi:hypothetical protein
MAKRPIAGKITVDEGMTTIDLHVGAQTVKLTIEDARELAGRAIRQGRELARQDMTKGKSKA